MPKTRVKANKGGGGPERAEGDGQIGTPAARGPAGKGSGSLVRSLTSLTAGGARDGSYADTAAHRQT